MFVLHELECFGYWMPCPHLRQGIQDLSPKICDIVGAMDHACVAMFVSRLKGT